ncbi:MAG TPA: MFS transporter [Gemmatimonadaceae bacterium]
MNRERVWIVVLASGFLGLMVDGMDLMFLSYSLPSLMRDFQIDKVQAGALASYTLLGMAVGGFFGGWAADRFGRVRVVVWTIMLFSIATGMLALTQTYWQFALLRFISALGLGAEYVVSNTLMAEYVPTARRTTVLGTLQAGWSVGYVVAALLAGAIVPSYGWRPLFAVAIVPVLLALVIRRVVPEPESWTRTRSHRSEFDRDHERSEGSALAVSASSRRGQWRAVFASPAQRRVFFLWTVTSCFLQFGNYGVSNWLPTYLVSELKFDFTKMTGYLVSTYIAMIVGKIIAGYLADRFGRRWIYVFGGLGTALFLPLIVSVNTPENIVVLLGMFGFLYGVPYGVNATYMTESFDTNVRATAVGGAYNLGRVGAAIAPALIGLLATKYSIGLGLTVMGGAYLLTAVVPAFFIREKMYDPHGRAVRSIESIEPAREPAPVVALNSRS